MTTEHFEGLEMLPGETVVSLVESELFGYLLMTSTGNLWRVFVYSYGGCEYKYWKAERVATEHQWWDKTTPDTGL